MGDKIVVSFSGLRDWKTCRQMYYYKRIRKLAPKITPQALKRGSWIHELLEAYYKHEDWEAKLETLQEEYNKLTEEEQDYYGNLPEDCGRLIRSYIRRWQDEPLETVAVELSFGPRPTDQFPPVELAKGIYLSGRVDWVCKDKMGNYWVSEHKSTKGALPTDTARLFDLQTAIYALVAEELLDIPIAGVMFDYLKTKPPTPPRMLAKGKGLSKAKKIRCDYATYVEAIENEGFRIEDYTDILDYLKEAERVGSKKFFERKYLPKPQHLTSTLLNETKIVALEMGKLANYPFRNMRRECNMCSFYNLCMAELMGLDTNFMLKKDYIVKDHDEEKGGEFDEEGTEENDSESSE